MDTREPKLLFRSTACEASLHQGEREEGDGVCDDVRRCHVVAAHGVRPSWLRFWVSPGPHKPLLCLRQLQDAAGVASGGHGHPRHVRRGAIGKAECTDSIETICDLTSIMADPRLSYRARVRAIPGGSSAVHTVLWVMSPSFVPYDNTELGKPQFEAVGRNGSIQMKVADVITPYFNIDGSHKTMSDIYKGDLRYHLTYWKDGSSGRKDYQSRQAAFTLTGLDEGQLYCFHVQLLVDVDNTERRGEESDVKCARSGIAKPDYAWIFLVAAGITALIIGVALIVLIVWLCHRCRQQRKSERNGTVVSYTAAASQRG